MRAVPEFIEVMKTCSRSGYYWRLMSNVWLVDTQISPQVLADSLKNTLTEADSLFVIRVKDDYGGWLTQPSWDWLHTSRENGDFDRQE